MTSPIGPLLLMGDSAGLMGAYMEAHRGGRGSSAKARIVAAVVCVRRTHFSASSRRHGMRQPVEPVSPPSS